VNKHKRYTAGQLFYTKKGNIILAAAIPAVLLLFGLIVNIFNIRLTGWLPTCYFKEATGMNCPGCGGTRSVQSLLHLDIWHSLWYNPVVFILIITLAVLYVRFVLNLFKKTYTPPKYDFSVAVAYIIGAVAVIFLIVRNLPFYHTVFY
jgi:hypothetical protein